MDRKKEEEMIVARIVAVTVLVAALVLPMAGWAQAQSSQGVPPIETPACRVA